MINTISVWVTSSSQTVRLGTLPINAQVIDVDMHVTELFNSDGTDTITVGFTGTTNAFATSPDVSTTGFKSVSLGSGIGYLTTAREVYAYYTNSGSEPTTGKCLVTLYYTLVPVSP